MPRLTNLRHEKFCHAYINPVSKGILAEAARIAGFADCSRFFTAAKTGCRLMKREDVKKRLEELLSDALPPEDVTDQMLEQLVLKEATDATASRDRREAAKLAMQVRGMLVSRSERVGSDLSTDEVLNVVKTLLGDLIGEEHANLLISQAKGKLTHKQQPVDNSPAEESQTTPLN